MRTSGLLIGTSLLAAAALACAAGCSTPSSQLNSCQADKEQLLATIREQRESIRAQDERLTVLERNLGEAEKELARGGSSGTRVSSRPTTNSSTSTKPSSKPATTIPPSQLPWRTPAKGDDAAPSGSAPQSRTGNRGSASSVTLASLAAQDSRLSYDEATKTAGLDMAVPFADDSAALTAESRRQLDDVARWLKARERAGLKVVVSGYATGRPARGPTGSDERYTTARQLAAARAQAVADYLDSHGIAEERLAVVSGGAPAAGDSALGSNASGVKIVLAEADTPLIGWAREGATMRR
jgi:outer membrane protein OmpA-like peptidoglycan-associated protein